MVAKKMKTEDLVGTALCPARLKKDGVIARGRNRDPCIYSARRSQQYRYQGQACLSRA